MTIIHSSDLGWTAGQDISDEFAALAETLKPGDTFVFDHMYQISGQNLQLADNVTLAGGAPGAGIDIQDFDQHANPLIKLGDSNVLVDLTITHKDIVADAQVTNGASIHAFGDDIQIINCSFEGKPKEFVRAGGDGLSVVDTVFDGSYYQMRWLGEATNFTVENSLFQNSEGDGIKTARTGDGLGTEGATISNSVFMNNARDGIDATAGFKDSLVTDSYFLNNFTALDLKIIFDDNSDPGPNLANSNITITNSEFIGRQKDFIVTTLLNRDGTPVEVADAYAPNNITVSDSIFENTLLNKGDGASWFIKDGYELTSTNNQYLGKLFVRNDSGNADALTQIGDTTGPARAELPDSYYQSLAGPDWSNISYPTDGTATPVDPVVEPDPIVYQPEPPVEADPIVEAPESSNGAPVANDDVATTDHDTTILVDVLGNDSDPEGDTLTLTEVSYSGSTSIVSIEDGKIKVNPLSSATQGRVETIVYTVSDGEGGTDTAELKVSIAGQGEVSAPQPPADPEPIVTEPVEPEPEPVVEPPVVEAPEPDSAPITSASDLLNIFVAYTDTDETISAIGAGSSIDSSLTDGRWLTIYAVPNGGGPEIGSVRLTVDGVSRVENIEPYALFGDRGISDFKGGKQFSEGSYTADFVVYNGKNGSGEVLETVAFDFSVDAAAATPTDPVQAEPDNAAIVDVNLSTVASFSESQDTGTATVSSNDQSTIKLEGSAWKSLDLFGEITEETVLMFDFKSDVEGEIHGIGFVNEGGDERDLKQMFFQLDGSQQWGIQDFSDTYETGSGFKSYAIPVGEYFTGSADQIVLLNDDDADLGSMSMFSNIGLFDGIA